MRSALGNRSLVQLACVAFLAGCGGGGGDGGSGPPASTSPTLTIDALNSDTVAHFTAAGVLALPIASTSYNMVSLTGSGPASAAAASPLTLLRQSRAAVASNGADRKQALQVMSTDIACDFGGSMSVTWNDADNNATESPGDVWTIVYHGCALARVNETYDGTMTMNVMEATESALTYNVSMAQLSYVTPRHSLAFNGSYVMAGAPTIDGLTATYTVNGAVTIAVTTHAPFTDTVTLKNGFVVREQFGSAANSLSASGTIESAFAGGSVDVSTVSPLITPTAQAGLYPSAGGLRVDGKATALTITAVSATSACVDVDTNGDGHIEKTSTPTWEWLL